MSVAFWIVDPDGNPIPFLGGRVSWAEWISEHWRICRVGNTRIPHPRFHLRVSTLFLGTSTAWPLFETMIFGEGTPLNLKAFRSETRPLARSMHVETVAVVRTWSEANP